MVRVSVCLNAGQRKGQAQAALVLSSPHTTEALLQAAANKLRLKKKEIERARLFVWKTGVELPRNESCDGLLRNDDLVAIALGEPYAGPGSGLPSSQTSTGEAAATEALSAELITAPQISGRDDTGREFASLHELWADQGRCYAEYYHANDEWWDEDGYGGNADEEAMIGDGKSEEDVAHSIAFLDRVRSERPQLQLGRALDGGAGIGRVTKHVLLRRCENVCLLEPCARWLKQARRYLGNKRAQRCSFVCERLESHVPQRGAFDLIWLQWCLQYLVDAHVVLALSNLSRALSAHGVLVLKENRPCMPGAEARRMFHVDMPQGPHGRYDITRPDEHHRWLFRCAGLEVVLSEQHDEVTCWVLRPAVTAAPAHVPQPELRVGAAQRSTTHQVKAPVPEPENLEAPWLEAAGATALGATAARPTKVAFQPGATAAEPAAADEPLAPAPAEDAETAQAPRAALEPVIGVASDHTGDSAEYKDALHPTAGALSEVTLD